MAKGGKREGAGRPKGKPNRTTAEFKEKLNELLEYAAPHMVKWLEQIATGKIDGKQVASPNPEKAFDVISKFAEYIHPKLSRSEIQGGDPDKPIQVNRIEIVAGKSDKKG